MSEPAICRKCGARMRVVRSRAHGNQQHQYLACPECEAKRSRVVDARSVWRRKR